MNWQEIPNSANNAPGHLLNAYTPKALVSWGFNENQLLPARQIQAKRKAVESKEGHQPLGHKSDKPQATEQRNRG